MMNVRLLRGLLSLLFSVLPTFSCKVNMDEEFIYKDGSDVISGEVISRLVQ